MIRTNFFIYALQVELSEEKIALLRKKIEKKNSIFKDKRYLDSLFLPSKIIGREKQAEQLIQYIDSLKQGLLVPVISVYGRSGAGKSTVIRFVCQSMLNSTKRLQTYERKDWRSSL